MTREPDRIEHGEPLVLVGLNITHTYEAAMNGIPAQWARFQPFIGTHPKQIGAVSYGVCHRMSAAGFEYFTGVHAPGATDLPAGFATLDIPAQDYAVFAHHGPLTDIRSTIDAAWAWAKSAGRAAPTAPMHLEVYGPDWSPEKDGGFDIRVALK